MNDVTINANPSTSFTYDYYVGGQQIFEKTLNNSGLRHIPNYVNEPQSFISPSTLRDLISSQRFLYSNNGIVKAGVDMLSIYSISNGFKLYSLCDNEALRDSYNEFLKDWAKIASVDGLSFNDILHQISNAISIDGDCFILLTHSKSKNFPQIQFLRPNRVRGDKNSKALAKSNFKSNKYSVLNGIVSNEKGKEIAYIIDDEQVVSAQSMIHCKDVNYLATNRGLGIFTHAVKDFRFLDDINEAELVAGKIASQIALVESNKTGTTQASLKNAYKSEPSQEGARISSMGNGQILYLQAGQNQSIDTLNYQRPSANYMAFSERLLRQALTGAGLSYDLLVNPDSSGVGIRSELSRFDKTCADRTQLLQNFVQKIIEYVIAFAIDKQLIEYSKSWYKVYITKPNKPSIDLGRQSQAVINEYKAGLRTLEECISPEMTVKEFATIRANELAIIEQARLDAEKKFKVTISPEAMMAI